MKRFLLVMAGVIAALGIITFFLPISDFTIEGENNYYSESELREKMTEGRSSRALIFFIQDKFMKHKTIPFIEKYTFSFRGFRHVTAHVYEKALIGFIRFQQYYLYFDWDGTLVESSPLRLPNVIEITGLDNDHAVIGEKLKTPDKNSFSTILTVTQFLRSNYIRIGEKGALLSDITESIHFSQAGVSVVFGDISVFLGTAENLEAKLAVMCDTLPELYGRKGTLYLDTYKPGQLHPSYIFK